jgi:hypothetical protein
MGVVALVTWLSTAGGGLYLLAVWLIEYDREFQTAAKTRLPIPVISAHALLAMTGLVIWTAYLFTDNRALAWTSLAILGAVVALGLAMAARWLRVFRQPGPPVTARPGSISTVAAAGVGILPSPRPAAGRPGPGARGAGRDGWNPERDWRSPDPDAPNTPSAIRDAQQVARDRHSAAQAAAVPPERNFPVPVVILHGVLALVTVTLVAITALRGL